MDHKPFARLLSTASFVAFVACLCFGAASVTTGMQDGNLVTATLLCLVWSYLAARRAEGRPT